MMIESVDFKSLVDQVMKDAALGHMRPVIEKELLHYDLLYALDKESMLDSLVFQGGTSLRLCYGGSRFSEVQSYLTATLRDQLITVQTALGREQSAEPSFRM
ncbi:nucleotidyl transferase AbiEii/AbiGii toxin family protein [Halomonas sp. 86]|nr:nucleotidyl transferase AbiEii/AbiGii toxin family protein [Halomonas citrativorans]